MDRMTTYMVLNEMKEMLENKVKNTIESILNEYKIESINLFTYIQNLNLSHPSFINNEGVILIFENIIKDNEKYVFGLTEECYFSDEKYYLNDFDINELFKVLNFLNTLFSTIDTLNLPIIPHDMYWDDYDITIQ